MYAYSSVELRLVSVNKKVTWKLYIIYTLYNRGTQPHPVGQILYGAMSFSLSLMGLTTFSYHELKSINTEVSEFLSMCPHTYSSNLILLHMNTFI